MWWRYKRLGNVKEFIRNVSYFVHFRFFPAMEIISMSGIWRTKGEVEIFKQTWRKENVCNKIVVQCNSQMHLDQPSTQQFTPAQCSVSVTPEDSRIYLLTCCVQQLSATADCCCAAVSSSQLTADCCDAEG